MTRTDVINRVARDINAGTYAELGVRNPADNFDKVNVPNKCGCDLTRTDDDRITQQSTDEFFATTKAKGLFFIDADHRHEQNLKDFRNAIFALRKGGAIIMHDCLPKTADACVDEKPPGGGPWNGTVWKTWRYIRGRKDLASAVVSCDHGCGIVMRAKRKDAIDSSDESLNWANADQWANVVSEADFAVKGLGCLG